MANIPFLIPPGAAFHTPTPDPNNPRAGDWLAAWDGTMPLAELDVAVIGAPLSRASLSHNGAFLLPGAVRRVLLDYATYSSDYGVSVERLIARDIGDVGMDLLDVRASHEHIAAALAALFAAAPFVVTLGGDHSITFPALVARARVAGASLGVIQFDAHHDVRVLDNGPNNGTPIRGAIEAGAIRGEHVAQIGINGFSNSAIYASWAREHGIGVHTMHALRARGLDVVLADAIEQAGHAPGGIYVTVDMDVLDRAVAPGCPASAPGGLATWQLCDALFALGQHREIIAIDFVEVDPTRDVADMTVKATCLAVLAFLAGRAVLLGKG
jgi:formiminoglutamase